MSIDYIVSNMLNGEVIHDGLVIGIVLIVFMEFYYCCFGAVFSLFKK